MAARFTVHEDMQISTTIFKELNVYRIILLLCATFTLLIRYIFINEDSTVYDPLAVRIAFSLILILIFTLTYFRKASRYITYLNYLVFGLYSFYALVLIVYNNFAAGYVLELIILVIVICLAFKYRSHVNAYLLLIFFGFSVACIAFLPDVPDIFMYIALVGIFCAAIFIFFDSKMQVESKITAREKLLNTVFNQSPDALLLVNPESGEIESANQRALLIFESEKEELIGSSIVDVLKESEKKRSLDDLKDKVDRSNIYRKELEFSTCKGKVFWGSEAINFLEVANDEKWLVRITDISEFKRAEEAIRSSEERYKLLLQEASDGIYLTDPEGYIITANSKACEMFGYSLNELTGKSIKELIAEDDKRSYLDESGKENNTMILERQFVRKSGEPFMGELSAKVLPDGRHQGIIRDITERKKIEEILTDSEKKFRALIQNSSDIFTVLSDDLRINFVSNSITRILGYTPDEVQSKPAFQFIHQEDIDQISSFFSKVLSQKEKTTYLESLRIKHKKGYYKYVETAAVNLLNDPAVKGIILNIHDIDKRKKAEIELLNTNFELDSFVYKASHDLKAPLRSIMGLIKLAKYENRDPVQEKYLMMMTKSVQSLDAFIKDLTQFSRNSRLKVQPKKIYFNELVDDCLSNLKFLENADKVKVNKKLNIGADFYSDITRISAIIGNLLSNAFKYHRFENNNPYINIEITTDLEKAIVSVEDNGQGIDSLYVDKVFDMFFRASETSYGSGLGLYIVKGAVEKLNGTITVDSEPEKGTTFKVELPNLINDIEG